MRKSPVILGLAAALLLANGPAKAQSVSPQQVQAQIANGQAQTALSELQPLLQAHPDSGVAWYLDAEAQDANGDDAAARTALGNAEHFAPGLPFAKPQDVAALQSRVNGDAPAERHGGISPVLLGILILAILFFVLRMFLRPRRFGMQPNMPGNPNAPMNYRPGFGQPPAPYGYGPPATGGGLGGSILGGLAAGAGFAAGERAIDDMFGNNNNGGNLQDPNFGGGAPGADDGLQGDPGWDASSGGQDDNFDPGNNW